jgi:hypothetical protein
MVRYVLEFNKARNNPELLANFHEYLRRSYNREPLEFLMAIDNDYKQQPDPKTKIQNAKSIADTYITDGSNLEINIDVFTKRSILLSIQQLQPDSPNLETLFDEIYKLVFLELKNDSFVRYLDSELFKEFSAKKGEKFMNELILAAQRHDVTFSNFHVNGNILDHDIINLLRMTEDITDWIPLQVTKKKDRAQDYYSYISKSKYPLDGIVSSALSGKFVGVLPVSAEQALYVLLDREYRSRWEPFVKYQVELPMHNDGDYQQTVCYAEIKFAALIQTRYSSGNTTVLYDTERRCYIWISKTTTGVDHKPLMKKKNAIYSLHISIYVVYQISETRCRYVTCNHSFLNMRDFSDGIYKSLFRKRGKLLFEQWVKLSKERNAKYGSERPKNTPELDTLDTFKTKYLPASNSVKTWST